jgi:hypothetical protein
MATLQPPANGRGRARGVPLTVGVVRVWEPNALAGVGAIEWLLLTNVAVVSDVDAWERVGWYSCRMVVEEYHKGMKTGVSIESLQLTTRVRLEAARWVEVLSVWRHQQARPAGTVGEFLMALGRLGGHQKRPSDGSPGWLTLWRGWAQLQAMLNGAAIASPRSGGT